MNIGITTIVTCIFISTFLLSSYECQTLKNNDTSVGSSSQFLVRNGIYKMKEIWRKLGDMSKNENTFVGNVLIYLFTPSNSYVFHSTSFCIYNYLLTFNTQEKKQISKIETYLKRNYKSLL